MVCTMPIIMSQSGNIYYAAVVINKNTSPKITILQYNYISSSSNADFNRNFDESWFDYYYTTIKNQEIDLFSYSRFWDSLGAFTKKTIYVINDYVYHKINLNSIYNPFTEKYIIEDRKIHYIQSLKNFKNNFHKEYNDIAILFGNPNFGLQDINNNDVLTARGLWDDSLFVNKSRGGYLELPNSEIEIKIIDDFLQNKNWNSTMFSWDQANEYNLKSIQSPRLLHIATHGQYENSKVKSISQINKSGLLNGALILAGADFYRKNKNKDINGGIFTGYEASLLNLKNTELVVLSACHTASGEYFASQGVVGLQRGFLYAGTQNLIMSLWPVDDSFASFFMEKFYFYWIMKNHSIQASFRKTQLDMLKSNNYSDPLFWGAFILLNK